MRNAVLLLGLVTAVATSGVAAAEEILALHFDLNVDNAEAGIRESHTADVLLFTGEDGTPAAGLLVDGNPVVP